MAKGFKHGSGGSNPLNFKVICNPKPENARENTIWVDTDRINNYYFSATQPENMEEYDVWFPIGTSSPVGFNAVKKNGIQVYPISAKQYVNGAWVDKTAKSWQGGKWVDWWSGVLYESGNEWRAITGGWNSYAEKNTTTSSEVNSTTVMTKHSSDPELVFSKDMSARQATAIRHDAFLDFTDYTTLTMNIRIATTEATTCGIRIISETGSILASTNMISGAKTTYDGVPTVDISSVPGKCRAVIAINTWGTFGATVTVNIRDARMS